MKRFWIFLLPPLLGIKINSEPYLYLADLVCLLIGAFALIKLERRLVIKIGGTFIFFTTFFAICDLINSVEIFEMAKAQAKNLVFFFAILSGLFVVQRVGPKGFFLLFVLTNFSRAVWAYLQGTINSYEGLSLVKHFGGYYGFLIPYHWLSGIFIVSIVFLIFAGAYLLYEYKFRSMAFLLGYVTFFCLIHKWRDPKGRVILLNGCIVAGIFLVVLFFSFMDTWFYGVFENAQLYNWEFSKARRIEGFLISYDYIAAKPLFGHGSGYASFVFARGNEGFVESLHSFIFQFGVQYGILGFALVGSFLFLALRAFISVVKNKCYFLKARDLSIEILLNIFVYSCLFSPFGNWSRIEFGLLLGFTIFINLHFYRAPEIRINPR